ncbi:MAG: DUF2306 domain-containing protein [Chloroflexota bacterium]
MKQARKRPLSISRGQWGLLGLLILLCVVPVIGGSVRLIQLAIGVEITSDNARFFASPVPVVVHIISSSLYCALGATQFIKGLRHWKPRLHRWLGRILLPAGILSALSGIWMTLFYPLPELDRGLLSIFRLIFGGAMVVFLCVGYLDIRRRNFKAHEKWMMRAYAIGLGAGTQVFTLTLGMLILGGITTFSKAMLMLAGWMINLLIAEYFIRHKPTKKRQLQIRPQI